MNKDTIAISNDIWEQLAARAAEAYPFEGCGVLLGNGDDYRIRKIRKLKNSVSREAAESFFSIDPLSIYELEDEEKDYEIIGFYHTHPEHKAVPSKEDEKYMIPGMIYMIISVTGGFCSDFRLYHRQKADGEVSEIKIGEAA